MPRPGSEPPRRRFYKPHPFRGALSMPAERCARINLGHRDYHTLDPRDWAGHEDDGLLLVEYAGETLYRLRE